MKTTATTLDDNKVRLEVEVSTDDLKPSLDQAARDLSRDVNIHGFRKGKVPRPVLERHIGADTIRQEAVRIALPRALAEAIDAEDLDVIGRPEVEEIDDGEDGSLLFTATVDTRPEITIGDLSDLEIELDVALEPTEDEIAEQIEVLRTRFATTEEVHRSAREDDHVVMNLETTIHGDKIDALTKSDIMYHVGSGRLVDKLDEKLDGARAGEILKFNEVLPDFAGEHAGEEATFSVLVKEVREVVKPEVTDEWVEESSEFDTVDELRAEIARTLTVYNRQRARAEAQEKAISAIAERTGLAISESLVDDEVDAQLHELEHDLGHRGASIAQYLQSTGESIDDLKASMRDEARTRIRTSLVLQAVAEENDIEPTAEEIGQQVAILAAQSDRKPEKVLKELRKTGRLGAIVAGIARGKSLSWILENATVLDANGFPVDFDEPEAEAGLEAGLEAGDEAEAPTGESAGAAGEGDAESASEASEASGDDSPGPDVTAEEAEEAEEADEAQSQA